MSIEWYVCQNFPSYSITKHGLMKNNKTGNILKKLTSKSDSHLYYSIMQDGIVYRKAIRFLVADQFIPNPQGMPYVTYLDGNPNNCSVENLAWTKNRIHNEESDKNHKKDYSTWYPWKECSKYDINKKGQMRNHETSKILKPSLAKDGYLYYSPLVDGKIKRTAAHICVAKQFIPNPEHKRVVNHIDEDRTNCHINNLEWVTHKENSNHATASQRISDSKVKPINEYDLEGHYIRTWKSIKAFYDFYNLDYLNTGQGQALRKAARNNANSENQMAITFGRIFTLYNHSIENIYVNCTKRSLVRAKPPFPNQKVPQKYLYTPTNPSTTYKRILNNMLQNTFLTPAQKDAIKYGIECIEKCQ